MAHSPTSIIHAPSKEMSSFVTKHSRLRRSVWACSFQQGDIMRICRFSKAAERTGSDPQSCICLFPIIESGTNNRLSGANNIPALLRKGSCAVNFDKFCILIGDLNKDYFPDELPMRSCLSESTINVCPFRLEDRLIIHALRALIIH